MKLSGDHVFDATVPEVWAALFDPVVLAAVLPGCEKLEKVGTQLVGEIKVKVGPVSGKFAGKVDLVDLDEPRSYRMLVDGRGTAGFVNANASVKLEPEGERTRIVYDADAQVGGKLAGVGQRLIEASTRAIVAQALAGLNTNIKLRAAAYRDANPEPVSVSVPVPESVPVPVAEPVAVPVTVAEPVAVPVTVAVAVSVAAQPAPKPVTFTPVKIKQSALASSVAMEVARTFFSRTVLTVIIALQSAVILWLLLR